MTGVSCVPPAGSSSGRINEIQEKRCTMNRVLALLAFVTFCGFVGILAFEVPSPDLVAVIIFTVALVGYDFATSSKNKPND